ncbi:hypothetical protein [Nostoc sp.]|uniref:hypothetical protein n=1 Tax=Nostoc sp. TaxID=1180 RepID=UPI002FFD401A
MNELETLSRATLLNRATFFNKVRDRQITSDRQQEQQVKILSYNTNLIGYDVQHPDGSVGFAKAISNSANLHKGAYVSLVQPAGTQTAIIDTTPR